MTKGAVELAPQVARAKWQHDTGGGVSLRKRIAASAVDVPGASSRKTAGNDSLAADNDGDIEENESDPNGTRTRVTGVKGRCPRPLDDGASAYNQPTGRRRKSS